ncbi:N-acetylglucosamine-6-phosphate deacetylase [Paenibacillus qinlingensis]|uniref:N-acetylglucosamine-6-phosphate deacetylase n=1 Tax=Paenibacillus qinlingensis TaxID=1837343 RepID=A0ABU1NSS6_9BACL|nr:N-acetylglucosamine-6-phosphate deacetylase [Paenibacillus qinlingensis]MDR6550498.1 N-acetylglucosamine-6-phosphate deacetylase [Paenibacillus qinlingensis]
MPATNTLVIQNGTIITAHRLIPNGVVLVENGLIVSVGEAEQVHIPQGYTVLDAQGAYIAPGFIDIHCHGGGGVWSWEHPYEFALAHLKHGTTAILPTFTYNESREQVKTGIQTILTSMNSEKPFAQAIVGIHMEGPYINNKYGAITSPIRPVDPIEYQEILQAAGNHIKVWTLAPELDGQEAFVNEAAKYEISFSVGHSEATAEQIFRFVPQGLRIGCHCTNASGTTPSPSRYGGTREVGVDEAVLVHDDIYAEVIPDAEGVHVRPLMLKLIHKTKGTDRVIIITDAMPDAGVNNGNSSDLNWNHLGHLAGSCLTMDKAVRNMMKHASIGLVDAFRMASLNPAKVIHMDGQMGSIEPGKLANLLLIDEEIQVKQVILQGQSVSF